MNQQSHRQAGLITIAVAQSSSSKGDIDEKAEKQLAGYAREYQSPVAMANYATETGGFPTGGRSAIWDESGNSIVSAPESGDYLAIAKQTRAGWNGQLIAIEHYHSSCESDELAH